MPQCTVIKPLCKKRIQEHLDRGWREIGVRQTWAGKFCPAPFDLPAPLGPRDRAWYADQDWGFTGRLWRDPLVSRETAQAETRRFILECPGHLFFGHQDGFAIITRAGNLMTVDLVASRDHMAGRILAHAAHALGTQYMQAGTYHDNLAAQGLYRKMGLHVVKREVVLHK